MSNDTLIRRTLRDGKRRNNDFFVSRCLPTPGQSTQWCLRVPKRYGSAPQRNRLRRLMREFIRTNKSLWPSESAVVVTATLAAKPAELEVVSNALRFIISDE